MGGASGRTHGMLETVRRLAVDMPMREFYTSQAKRSERRVAWTMEAKRYGSVSPVTLDIRMSAEREELFACTAHRTHGGNTGQSAAGEMHAAVVTWHVMWLLQRAGRVIRPCPDSKRDGKRHERDDMC